MTRFTATSVPRYSARRTRPKVPRPKISGGSSNWSSSLLTDQTVSACLLFLSTYQNIPIASITASGTRIDGRRTDRRIQFPPTSTDPDEQTQLPSSSGSVCSSPVSEKQSRSIIWIRRGLSGICSSFARISRMTTPALWFLASKEKVCSYGTAPCWAWTISSLFPSRTFTVIVTPSRFLLSMASKEIDSPCSTVPQIANFEHPRKSRVDVEVVLGKISTSNALTHGEHRH